MRGLSHSHSGSPAPSCRLCPSPRLPTATGLPLLGEWPSDLITSNYCPTAVCGSDQIAQLQ